MNRAATYLAVYLALILALTSMVSGPIRAGAASGTNVVICTTDGLKQITIGPDGQPVQPHPHCPDCVLAELILPPGVAGNPSGKIAAQDAPWRAVAIPDLFHIALWRLAREPPVLAV